MQLEPIAIIGIGCRFPGAENPQAFWNLMRDGVDAISEVPKSRWDIDDYYNPDFKQPGKTNTRWGGFLKQIDYFDAQFFGISPKEAVTMDPQQRLLLEVAWETLEDGGQIPEDLRGSQTGVFIGIGTHDYSIMMWQNPVDEPYATTGTGNCIAANRVSYVFDLKGPSLAVDTACSSSLVAVHLACQSIWAGESTMALAGGVNMLLLPTIMVGFSKGGFLSPDGRCKSFDADANGYVRGEGAGLVLLKPLSQAEADGDEIYGVIRSSAVNQDGCSNGIAAPNPQAQEAVLWEAYNRAGIEPHLVDYVEAHGTGTALGDPVEMSALGAVLGKNRGAGDVCKVGSVKTNIGHTETAAGIAGIIKVALALKNQEIPPSLHFNQPNSAIAWNQNRMQVVTELTSWVSDQPIIAGVNSFGFGGTNAHVVMQQYVSGERDKEDCLHRPLQILSLSAKSKPALEELARQYGELLLKSDLSLADVCYTANTQRSHFNHRLTCISASVEELQRQLSAFVGGKEIIGLRRSVISKSLDNKIAFLFTGQGSQYVGMGEQLYHTQSTFRDAIDKCALILQPYLDKPLLEVIFQHSRLNTQDTKSINRTKYTQPALFALEYALAKLWISWGIKPDYVMGHSIGEYVAACIAGVFSLKDGLKLVAARGRLMEELPATGGMLAVFASEEKVSEFIVSYEGEVNIAAINSNQNIVISGTDQALKLIQTDLTTAGVESKPLQVSHAFHSPLMQPMLEDFRQVAQEINYSAAQIPLVSCVTGNLIAAAIASPKYWVDHIIQPVRFADSFKLLCQKVNIFLEIGAKPTLSSIGKVILTESNYLNADISSLSLLLPSLTAKKDDWQVMLNSLAQLYHQGIKIDWDRCDRDYLRRVVKLPTYPFQRQRYWWEKAKFFDNDYSANENRQDNLLHPLLGNALSLAGSDEIRFQSQIKENYPLYLQDHCLESQVVFPATAYLEMALTAGGYIARSGNLELAEFIIHQPLLLSDGITNLQTVVTPEGDGYLVKIFSNSGKMGRQGDGESLFTSHHFVLHSEVRVRVGDGEGVNVINLDELRSRLVKYPQEIDAYYQQLSQQGLNYGVSFQNIKQLWQESDCALGYIELPEDLITQTDNYQLHPALLDACLQIIGAATSPSPQGVYLPVGLASLQLSRSQVNAVWAYVEVNAAADSQKLTADLSLYDDGGNVVAEIKELSLQYLSLASWRKLINLPETEEKESLDDWLYEITWQQQPIGSKSSEITKKIDNWLIWGDRNNFTRELASPLQGVVVFSGEEYQEITDKEYRVNPTNSEDFQQLWNKISQDKFSTWGIIYLSAANNLATIYETSLQEWARLLHLIQSIQETGGLSQILIISNSPQSPHLPISPSPIWALGKTINLEYPDLSCICLNLEAEDINNNIPLILQEIQQGDGETQISYQNQQRYVARLAPKDNSVSNNFRLQLSEYGTLENLTLATLQRRPPQRGEIEIEVKASGVNFRDVLNGLGVLKEYLVKMGFSDATQVPFGGECAGVVVAVGEGVKDFHVGDEVIAAQAVGSIASHVTVSAKLAIIKPEHLSFTDAATIPTTFLTADYGLNYLAKIKAGDKVLIHAAAGGVGQAAVQLAQQAGAEVYATASPGKWDFLKASGIKYVMNSRNLDYAQEIMALTEGKGVDIVLNSLNGDYIPKNIEILAPGGRFVEIGKVGIWEKEQLTAKRDDISYFTFDLLEISIANPDLIATLFNKLRQQFNAGTLQPLPNKVFPIAEAKNAFRYMAQAKHIGKVVIANPNNNSPVVKEDGCYLITGGWGALGLQVSRWLIEEGAKHLILIGRNQPSETAQKTITQLKQNKITIQLESIDVENYAQIEQLINNLSLPLRGIIHAAGILDDGLMKNLSWERFQRVLTPKVTGAWHLHLATQNQPLDWFVCFSSVVSVFGAAAQSNYAVANAFMDNLMNYRRSLGLPGLSINWSIWDEGGMANRLTTQQQQRLTQQGLKAIAPTKGLKVLKQLLQQQATQTIVFPVDWATFLPQQPANPFFNQVQPQIKTPNTPPSSFLQQLAATEASGRKTLLQEHIRSQIAQVLGYRAPDAIDIQEKFADLGMDSLMAVEFKNNLQTSLGNAVSLTAAFDYPTVELLTDYINGELSVGLEGRRQEAGGRGQEAGGRGQEAGGRGQEAGGRGQEAGGRGQEAGGRGQEAEVNDNLGRENKQPEVIEKPIIETKPEYYQFPLTPEYLNLQQDLARVEKLGNPFFSLHQGIAKDTIQTDNRQLINYSSYNYLGMSGDRIVTQATQDAIAQYGTSVSASRLLSGERPLHLELEKEIADLIGTEDAIIYVGGHATNVSTIGHLFGENDLIICDALSHNSIKEGCKLSGATVIDFPHNGTAALEQILKTKRNRYQKVLIAIEGIYSTDGDVAPVSEIVALKKHYQTFLLVDEAHSIGVLGLSGAGVREHFNLQPNDVDLWMGTLSKSFASCGGYIAGSREIVQYLKYTAPGFVFSVGMSPANTAAALAAIKLLKAEPQRVIKLQSRAKFCLNLAKSKNLNTGYSADSPIIPIIVGEPQKAVRLSQNLMQQGINVNPMVYPSVPYDAARLRFFITCLHSEEQIQLTMDKLEQGIAKL
jgi:myxalamid-type polyketide synthase MxaB